ncbi:tetraacyldisaccharide 4'-kinase [Rhodoferax sp. PAMC 29310]|uniref:tetraacyldisaccharide 4'-kinase n=1 Tax=Rhodoferax sp. PAMC 29310 TaxID=2822760 RepID=UPI001B33CEBB|nr:tetraacyldisaccharide 4'-kinase [Rhodoferax sp. PAMC 29310]
MALAQPKAWQQVLTQAWLHKGALAWSLWPISRLYGALTQLRQYFYKIGWSRTERMPVPVIVVGNVIAGGSGKTPVVMALVRHLQSRGIRVGVISRGHGRIAQDCREVTPDSAVGDVGDEPALIQRTTLAPVFVAARRVEAALRLLASYPDTQVLVCDDGLQHLALHRDLEICVFDDRGVGNGFLLPAGPLRESWPRPVDWVLHTGTQPAFAGFTAQRTLSARAISEDGHTTELADLQGNVSQKPLLAVAAIAKPDDFFAMLRAQGLQFTQTLALPDHYSFDSWIRNDYEGYQVICTEKDATKLWQHQPDALAVPLVLTLQPELLCQLDARLSGLLPPL